MWSVGGGLCEELGVGGSHCRPTSDWGLPLHPPSLFPSSGRGPPPQCGRYLRQSPRPRQATREALGSGWEQILALSSIKDPSDIRLIVPHMIHTSPCTQVAVWVLGEYGTLATSATPQEVMARCNVDPDLDPGRDPDSLRVSMIPWIHPSPPLPPLLRTQAGYSCHLQAQGQ